MPTMPAPLRFSAQCALLGLSLALWPQASAQDAAETGEPAPYAPATGDPWLDRHVLDINEYATRHPRAFADEVSRYYAVPRAYVEAMLQQPAWTPGDIFMACAVAQRVKQPCRLAVREWSRDHSGGWAGVAERLGLDPATKDHRQLRLDVESSYRRWARPLREK